MDIDEQIGVLADQIDAAKITSKQILDYFIEKKDYYNAILLEIIYNTLNDTSICYKISFIAEKETKKEDD